MAERPAADAGPGQEHNKQLATTSRDGAWVSQALNSESLERLNRIHHHVEDGLCVAVLGTLNFQPNSPSIIDLNASSSSHRAKAAVDIVDEPLPKHHEE